MACCTGSTLSCLVLAGITSLFGSAVALAGGEHCAGAGKAQVVAAAGQTGECAQAAKATACAGGAEVVAVADEKDCAGKAACAGEAVVAMAVGDSVECAACDAVHAAFGPVNATCPGSGQAVTDGITAQFAGFTVGFCCEDCQAAFNGADDAKKTAVVAKHAKRVNIECPNTGEGVSEEQVALYNGFAVGFCCEKCQAKFNGADDAKKAAILAKFVKPVNTQCPGSGEAIQEATVVAYHGVLIGFCSAGCQDHFRSANAEDQKKMTAKMVKTGAGGCSEACKAAHAEAQS